MVNKFTISGLRFKTPSIILLLAASWMLVLPMIGNAQQPTAQPDPSPEIRTEEDPTRPVLFTIRNEYRKLKNRDWANTVIFRYDTIFFKNLQNKGGAKGLIFRFDVPFNTVNRAGVTKAGLGDLYTQILYIPRIKRRFALAVGSGILFPTATDRILGQGKLILAPTAVPVWYFAKRKRLVLVRLQNYVSVAGSGSRPNVNFLIADPILVQRLTRKWWILANTELKWDWRAQRGSGTSGVQFGRVLRNGFGFWIKPELSWGPGRQGDFNLKFTFYRIR